MRFTIPQASNTIERMAVPLTMRSAVHVPDYSPLGYGREALDIKNAPQGTLTNRFGAVAPQVYDQIHDVKPEIPAGKLTSGVSRTQAVVNRFGQHNGGRAAIP